MCRSIQYNHADPSNHRRSAALVDFLKPCSDLGTLARNVLRSFLLFPSLPLSFSSLEFPASECLPPTSRGWHVCRRPHADFISSGPGDTRQAISTNETICTRNTMKTGHYCHIISTRPELEPNPSSTSTNSAIGTRR